MEIKSDFRFGSIDVTILLLYSYSYCDISSAKIFTHKISVENLSTHIFSSCTVHHLAFEILGLNFHLVSCKIERSFLGCTRCMHRFFVCFCSSFIIRCRFYHFSCVSQKMSRSHFTLWFGSL